MRAGSMVMRYSTRRLVAIPIPIAMMLVLPALLPACEVGDQPGDSSNTCASDSGGSSGSSSSSGVDLPDVVHQIAGVDVETLAGSGVPGAQDAPPAAFDNPVNILLIDDGT